MRSCLPSIRILTKREILLILRHGQIDASKGAKLFDFFQHSGWIQKA